MPACQRPGGSGSGDSAGSPGALPALPERTVQVEAARHGAIASYYSTTAILEVEKEAEIVARVEGVVSEIRVEEGDRVEEGEALLVIENERYRFLFDQARSRRESLQARYERLEKVFAEDVVSAEELETARNELAQARAAEGLARLDLDHTTVRAPFAGQITRRHVEVGHTSSPGDGLFTLADLDPLVARVHVPAREFRKIQTGQDVKLRLDSTGTELSGRIFQVAPIIETETGTIKVSVSVPDYPEGTRPGDFVQVRIVTELRPRTLLVHQRAVFLDRGEQVVYLAGAGDRAERRVVTLGFSDDDHREILSGLEAGDRVVIRGQRSLKPGTPLKIHEDPRSQPLTAEISPEITSG